jgi:hypothetical protein
MRSSSEYAFPTVPSISTGRSRSSTIDLNTSPVEVPVMALRGGLVVNPFELSPGALVDGGNMPEAYGGESHALSNCCQAF